MLFNSPSDIEEDPLGRLEENSWSRETGKKSMGCIGKVPPG